MTSSCGICGRASLEALKLRSAFDVADVDFSIPAARLAALPAQLAARQHAFAETGGLHATGLFDQQGELQLLREDVGRHNATDKVIGAALRAGQLPLSAFGLIISGRASFEILQKALMAGCPLVVAVGAPSSLAIELAWEFGLTLAGFLRDGRFNIYAGPGRIT
jgi:FdhD protein